MFLLQNVQTGNISGHWSSFPRLKRPGREFVYSPPPSSEVMNEWSYTLSLYDFFFLAWTGTTITLHSFILTPSLIFICLRFVILRKLPASTLLLLSSLLLLLLLLVVVVVFYINHADRISTGMVTSECIGEYKNRMFLGEIEHLKQYSRDTHSNLGQGTGYAVKLFVYFLFRQENSLTVGLQRNRPRHVPPHSIPLYTAPLIHWYLTARV